MPYSQLDAPRILDTIERLHVRIRERFPDASLTAVAAELVAVGRRHAATSDAIHRPNWLLRGLSALLLALGLGALVLLFVSVRRYDPGNMSLLDLVPAMEAGLSMLFLLAAAAVLCTGLELRRRRSRCLKALHELRALAHVVDMHQLTKDPEMALHPGARTASSPERRLTQFELARYLDYCSEMLSLMGKLAALYAQRFPDPQAVAAVDAIEDLTTGLSRKVWQKIMIIANHPGPDRRPA
ncbi:MAG: hypothetical protein H6835_05815 [Planctomycetes bacterium]|nr:hypothetical protein [Planctomycetota bacterium]